MKWRNKTLPMDLLKSRPNQLHSPFGGFSFSLDIYPFAKYSLPPSEYSETEYLTKLVSSALAMICASEPDRKVPPNFLFKGGLTPFANPPCLLYQINMLCYRVRERASANTNKKYRILSCRVLEIPLSPSLLEFLALASYGLIRES